MMSVFLIPLFSSYGQEEFISVCDRTPQVRDAIMEKIVQIDAEIECSDDRLIKLALYSIAVLRLPNKGITSLKEGDFSGLYRLTFLDLSHNQLTSLPQNIFHRMYGLKELDLSSNNLVDIDDLDLSDLEDLKFFNATENPLRRKSIHSLQDLAEDLEEEGVIIRWLR